MQFKNLPLASPILRAADELGYETPSPIQEQAIPPLVEGRDILGCAQTGTGKTAAFAMPILHRLSQEPVRGRRPIRALILTPTRELAIQIDDSFEDYGKYLPLRHTVIFGGVGQNPQVQALTRGVDILTATPGRLNDLINQGFVHLENVETFVLDEADRMLDMGFVQDVKRVMVHLPAQRQTMLFSATMPDEIAHLAASILHDPVKVMVTPPATTVDAIAQSLYFVNKGNKSRLLAHLIRELKMPSVLVFTRTKHGADKVVRELEKEHLPAMAIHGNKSQSARQEALRRFKMGELRVLVATDIAARGIDIVSLPYVLNYDLPNIPETYVHRIGRTGRAGLEGTAISFCMEEEIPYLKDIEKLTKHKIPVVEEHPWPMQRGADAAAAAARQAEREKAGLTGRPAGAGYGARPGAPRRKDGPHTENAGRRDAAQNAGNAPRRKDGPRPENTGRRDAAQNTANAPRRKDGPRTESRPRREETPVFEVPAHHDGAPRRSDSARRKEALRRAEESVASPAEPSRNTRPEKSGYGARKPGGFHGGPSRRPPLPTEFIKDGPMHTIDSVDDHPGSRRRFSSARPTQGHSSNGGFGAKKRTNRKPEK